MNENKKNQLCAHLLFNFSVMFIAAAFVLLDKRDFFDRFIICLPSQVLGFYCPFCGCTRSFYSLAQGDFLAAFRYNAVFPPFFAFFIFKDAQALYLILKNRGREFKLNGIKLFFILFLAFFVLRNALLIFGMDITGNFIK